MRNETTGLNSALCTEVLETHKKCFYYV